MSSIASPEFKMTRLETINEIISNDNKKIIITNLMGYLRFLPLSSTWKNKVVNLKVGEEINKEDLAASFQKVAISSIIIKTKKIKGS